MPNQCYHDGNFYQAKLDILPGNPPPAPVAWSLVQIPAQWRWILARLTYANLLELDGQKDKANAERANAIGDERRGLDWMIRTEANRERFLERPNVHQRNFV